MSDLATAVHNALAALQQGDLKATERACAAAFAHEEDTATDQFNLAALWVAARHRQGKTDTDAFLSHLDLHGFSGQALKFAESLTDIYGGKTEVGLKKFERIFFQESNKEVFNPVGYEYLSKINPFIIARDPDFYQNLFAEPFRGLLTRMRADNQGAPAPFQAGPCWQGLSARLLRLMARDGLESVANSAANNYLASSHPEDGYYYHIALHMFVQQFIAQDRERYLVPLTDHASRYAPDFNVTVGRRVVPHFDILQSAETILNLLEAFPGLGERFFSLLDLGGGWGRIGYAIQILCSSVCYLNADLPPALLAAQATLPPRLPGLIHVGYDQAAAMGEIDEMLLLPRQVWTIGTHHLPRLPAKSIDIVLAAYALQEMPQNDVLLYLQECDRLARTGVCLIWQPSTLHAGSFETIDELPFPAHWQLVSRRPIFAKPGAWELIIRV